MKSTKFYRLERESAGDLPFYQGSPVSLSGGQWLIVLAGVALGFMALIIPVPIYQTFLGGLIPAVLFFAIPLGALFLVAGSGWLAIFRPLKLSDFALMLAVALANLVVSLIVVLLIRTLFDMNANPIGTLLSDFSGLERVIFYLKTIPQLFGEEVVSVLPFLAVLWFCHVKLGMSRGKSLLIAWLSAAVIFGALHLPTYGWNFVQCFLVIGTARLVLLTGYLITKNIWVSTGAHILNDWIIFTFMLIAGG
ncbi:CPBP family glutamic-type intramembrane protease [Pseudomaricurvus sp.]|uniref:CPBP family glutamic-type intramembrane protease n=1 Tax=Pseudomaricurvus sp. TaxID=2004510 RepID=UPI003F6D9BDB